MTTFNKHKNQNKIFANFIMNHFDFLVQKFNFIKIPEYQFVREVHNDFVRENLIVKIVYDGNYFLEILKAKFDTHEIIAGKKRTVDYDYNNFYRYDLKNLDLNKEIYNSVSSGNAPEKELWYYAKLLNDNPEILKGNLTKLKWKYKILKRLKIK